MTALTASCETCSAGHSRSQVRAVPAEVDSRAAMRRTPVSLRDMVMTPDRVPEFTIPPLGTVGRARTLPTSDDFESSGTGPPKNARPYHMTWSRHSAPPEHAAWGDLLREDLTDPVTRAAMSLPHLPKITTPYGFLALGESPCVRRRESLFFEDEVPSALVPRPDKERHVSIPRTRSFPLCEVGNFSRPAAAATWSARSLSLGREPRIPASGRSSSTGARFKLLLKKRLAAVRRAVVEVRDPPAST
ncbi:C2 calcium-dependent domain-containing protein 4C-like [Arapaima gigas]